MLGNKTNFYKFKSIETIQSIFSHSDIDKLEIKKNYPHTQKIKNTILKNICQGKKIRVIRKYSE